MAADPRFVGHAARRRMGAASNVYGTRAEDASDVDPERDCPTCGSEGGAQLMGVLGSKAWYRCRNCGADASPTGG